MTGSALAQGNGGAGDGADVNGTSVQFQLPTLPPGQVQQLVDQTDQAVGLALGNLQGRLLAGLGGVNQVDQQALDGCQRGAQVVGYFADELGAGSFQVLQPSGHVVDALGQAPYFIRRIVAQADVQVACGDVPGGLFHVADGAAQPAGQEHADQQGCHDSGQDGDQQDTAQGGQEALAGVGGPGHLDDADSALAMSLVEWFADHDRLGRVAPVGQVTAGLGEHGRAAVVQLHQGYPAGLWTDVLGGGQERPVAGSEKAHVEVGLGGEEADDGGS